MLTPDGSVYALLIINSTTASAFVNQYPAEQVPGYPPDFPDPIFDEFYDIRSYLENILGHSHQIADEMALAFILEQYNSGVALLKQDSNGQFKRLRTQTQIQSDGSTTYFANNCP